MNELIKRALDLYERHIEVMETREKRMQQKWEEEHPELKGEWINSDGARTFRLGPKEFVSNPEKRKSNLNFGHNK